MANKSAKPSRYFLQAVVVLMMAIATGCQSINPLPTFGIGDIPAEEERIRELMGWHSDRVEVYRDFRTIFTARAVYLSDEIQRLASDWEARSKLMNPEERARFEKRFLGKGVQGVKVLVGFYTPAEGKNDLSRENSQWIPYLQNPDGTATRATCLDVDEDNARIYMRFLNWDLSWSKLYIFCFPISVDPGNLVNGSLSLVISGPEGKGTMNLKVIPPEKVP